MSLTTGRNKLYTALKELRSQWEETRRQWRDPVAQLFEERIWNQLEQYTLSAVNAIDRLDQVLLRVQNECK